MNQKNILAALAVLALAGCQTVPYEGQARDVKKKPQEEGVIAIPSDYKNEDRAKAEQKMAANCAPAAFRIMEEGEVAVGQKTQSNSSESDRAASQTKLGSLWGIPLVSGQAAGKDTQTSQTTTQLKEWQISYKCDTGKSTR